jgi:hypothetical protein
LTDDQLRTGTHMRDGNDPFADPVQQQTPSLDGDLMTLIVQLATNVENTLP